MNERERRAYIEQMEAQLEAWKADLAKLKAEGEARDSASTRIAQLAEHLRKRVDAASERLQELRVASQASWAGAKAGVDAAWKELKEAWEENRSSAAHTG